MDISSRILNCSEAKINMHIKHHGKVEKTIRTYYLNTDIINT